MENNFSNYIEVLMEAFKPASTVEEATHFFTTEEVFDAIKSLNPGAEIAVTDIYSALLEAGFLFKQRRASSAVDFRWILTAK